MLEAEDNHRKQVVIDGTPCVLNILDAENVSLLDIAFPTSLTDFSNLDRWVQSERDFILVYSVVNRQSFRRISEYHNVIT